MNPCPKYEESLILHSHQDLGRKEVVTLKKHLSQRQRCRIDLDALSHVSQIIESHPEFCSNLFLDIEW